MRIYILAVALLGAAAIAQAQVTCPPQTIPVNNGAFQISRPATNFPNTEANVIFVYRNAANPSDQYGTRTQSQDTHSINGVPNTVTSINVLAFGTSSNTQFTCEFNVQHVGVSDPCSPNPCQNNGACNANGNQFQCTCTGGFSGNTCQTPPTTADPCNSSPCQNGGVCTSFNNNQFYQCTCQSGFIGTNCQIPPTTADPCNSSPCQNGGVCTSFNNNQFYQCNCQSGFIGTNCQTQVGQSCGVNPCQNGGVCTLVNNQIQCQCQNGFSGSRCETVSTPVNVNPCQFVTCSNGGQCFVFGSGSGCHCPAGWGGPLCRSQVSGGPCVPNPCNTGQCLSTGSTSYTCNCPSTHVGRQCQVLAGSVTTCNPNPCSNGGQCNTCNAGTPGCTADGYTCSCGGTNGFTGSTCQYSPAETCAPGSLGAQRCGTNTCLNRNVAGEANYVCVCEDAFSMGFDCNVDSDNRFISSCYGSECKRRLNRLGDQYNYFETIDYPTLYEDRLRALYLLYLPGVTEICFEFDQTAFGIEDNKDELYVGPGLQFDFAHLQGRLGTPNDIFFFENRNITNGRTPSDFCIPSDTVWMYFLTDKNIMMPGWRLYWTISDVVPPQATCPADITDTVPLGAGGITVTWTEPQAFDDSGVPPILVSRSHSPGQFFTAGRRTTVTYTWRDGADNEGGCSFSILVTEIDSTPPVVSCPSDISRTTACGTGGTTEVTWNACTATDNSGTATMVSQSHQSGRSFFVVGRTEVTYTYTDPSNNRASGSFFVTVTEVDTMPPVCVPPNDISRTISLGDGFTTVSWTEPRATDNCGLATLVTRTHAPGDRFLTGTTRVSYTFRDDSSNTVVCGFDVVITEIDTVPPVVTCPDDITREIPLNVGGVSVGFMEATATDNSGRVVLVSRSHTPGQQFTPGSTTVTYTFEDPSNNRASCSFTILVIEVDRTPPQVTCPQDISRQIPLGSTGGTTVPFDEATATDNSGTTILVSRSHTPNQFFVVGTTEVTYEFRDPSGNSAMCSFTIFVVEVDEIPPNVVCPNDISRITDCNTGGTTDVTWQPCTATDNSGTATLITQSHQTGQFFTVGRTEVTYTFRDPSNNIATGSFFVTVTEVDSIPPVCIPPDDITRTISLGGNGFTTVSWTEPRATDNCGQATFVTQSHAPGDRFFVGTTRVSYTFRDDSSNTVVCGFDVTVTEVDTVPPVVTCPDDITREIPLNIGGVSVGFMEATATDNSQQVTLVTRSHTPGQQFTVGSTTVTYTFEDPSNNRASCSFIILVIEVDRIPPQVTCPPDIVDQIQLGSGGTTVSFEEATATDNSGTTILVSRSHTPNQFFTVGTTEVTYEFRDPSGNSAMCSFTITIIEVDDVPPVPRCPRDISTTTACNSGGTVEVTWDEPTVTDNSGTANVASQTHNSGRSFFQVGTTTVTYTFTDPSNNRASCDFVVTVIEIDPVPPQCTNTPDDITREVPLNTGGTTVNFNEPIATDDCGTVTLQSRSHAPRDFFSVGITRVNYIFVDGAGNTVSCSFNVQINEVDRVLPVCDCGDDITRTIPLNVGGANVVFPECTATDNSLIVRLESRSHSPGQRFPTGRTQVEYIFSDPSDNRVTCGFSVIVTEVDEVVPVCRPNNPVTETVALGLPGRTVNFPEPQATDNSGTVDLRTRTHAPGAFFPIGLTEVCYTFADQSGNVMDCCVEINIVEVDEVPPIPSCPRDISTTTACNTGGTVEVTWLDATATDNSGTANLVSQSHNSGRSFFRVGPTTVTYTFADPSNNRASCDFVVTVIEIDPVPPQCTNTPQDITREVPLGTGGTTINYNEPRATDDCGPATLQSRSHAPGDFFNTGRSRVTYTFVDGSGNTVSCGFNVQVNEVDRIPPVCECGEDITRTIPLPQGGVGGTNIVFPECTATDNSGTVSREERSHTPGQRFTTGTTEVMYEFSDPSNNRVSCSFRITVIEVDDEPPVCIPSNDVTETIDLGQFGRTVTFPEPRATDNSGTANLQSRSHTPGAFFQVGTTDVCYTFADQAGNTVDCCFQITIIEVDTVPPNPNCPRDVARTTACNTGGTVDVTWQPATATDNSGTATLVSQSHRSGQSFFPLGQTTVTYTYIDPSNNRASCDFVVTVTEIDPVPPQCTSTPQDITREVALSTGGTTINYNEPIATDDCGQATLQSRSHAPGDFFNTGRTQVTYTFVDGSGNTVSCTFNVQVNEVDRIPPVCECGEDITRTIPLPQGGVGGTNIVFPECTATDNSGTVSLEGRSHTPGQRFTTGTTEVMYEFSDPSNNRVSCSFRITVIEVDEVPPVCGRTDDVTESIPLGTFGTIVNFVEPTATDNSGTVSIRSRTHSPGSFFQVETTEVCYTFADGSGNTVDCCFFVRIIEVDTVPPNPNCPRDVSRTTACNTGGTVDVTWQPATATDNSGTVNLVSQSHQSGQSFFLVGTTTVTYTFSDPSNNRASCEFVVTVTEVDPVPPQCTNTPQDITREVPLGTGGTTINYNEPRATDDCGPATLQSRSHAPGDFFNTGRSRVTYTFVDGSGNTVSCGFNVQVNEVDRMPPVCECGDDITRTIPLPQGGVGGTNIVFPECTATDNSGTVSLEDRSHTPGQRFTTGTTEVMYEFSDPSNNRVSCSFRITVIEVDEVPPVCGVTPDVTESIPLGTFGTIVTFREPTATDNSGTVSIRSRTHSPGSFFQVDETEVCYTFADGSGNTVDCCFFVRIVEVDEVPPVPSCPRDITRTIDINLGGTQVTFQDATATDNSGTAILVTQTHRSGQFFIVGTTDVTYTFRDPSNNQESCTFTITVIEVDTEPPVPQCPDDQEISIPLASPPGSGRTTVTWIQPTATDNSGQFTISSNTHTSGDLFNTGSTVVTYVFTDASDNRATCSWTVTVIEVDSTPPVCTCGNDVSQTTPLGTGGSNVVFQDCTATDNSQVATRTSRSHSPGAFFTSGRTDVVYVFSDPSGNTVSCGFAVTVTEIDEIPPQVIGCPPDIEDTVDLGQVGKTVSWTEPSSRDNSGTSSMTSRSHRPGAFFTIGVTEVTYVFSDPSGNTADCSFTITIIEIDNEPPIVRCPAPVQLTILTGLGGAVIEWDEATATDNSGTATLVSRSHTPGSFFSIGETSVTYTFTDPSGNRGTCSFTVSIIEENPCLPQPCLNGGVCVIETTSTYTCLCPDCYSGDICQDGADACTNHGCSNGAVCESFPNSCTEYTCQCTDCFSGRFCTERADPCENHQCQNGAQCVSDPSDCTEYQCICPSCYSGQFCQNAFDACTNHQCQNGGQCIRRVNGGCTEYTCSCSGCFTGPFCQDMRDPCEGNPCQNGALCSPLRDNCYSYRCECNGCFTGYNCEDAIPNPCNENPCQNGGICNVIPGECFAYSCRCQAGFAGINCGQIITINQNPCTSFPCLNGGSCLTMDATYYICVCPAEYLGINCQTRRAIQINFDACTSNPCINGDCFNSYNSNSAPNNIFRNQYTCVCNRGNTGSNCALRTIDVPELDICQLTGQRMCLNGGTCWNNYHSYDQDVDYFCECPIGFIGHNCETVYVDPCRSSPCLNNGQCNSFNTFFTCTCRGQFAGTLCQININQDDQPPIIQSCPPSQYFFTTSGSAQATWTRPTATDNVDPNPRLERQTHQPNTFFQLGTTAVTYVFVDSSNNAATCTFFITVYSQTADITPPVISNCPTGVQVTVSVGETGGTATWIEPIATDNSGASPSRVRTHTPGARFPVGTTRVTYTFTDGSNNRATCSFNVVLSTGSDTIPPVITGCPATAVIVQVGQTAVSGVGRWNPIQATDNSGAVPTVTQTHRSGDTFQLGQTSVTYTFRDGSGNSAECRFTVNVIRSTGPGDQIPPVISNCPTGVQVQVPASANSGVASWSVPTATDNSGVTPNRISTHNPGSVFNVGITTVTYTFTDGSGNAAICFFDVSVTRIGGPGDTQPPTLTFCPNDIIANANQGSSFEQVSWQLPTATDDSGTATLASGSPFGPDLTSTFFSVGENGIRDLIYTFTDPAGNERTCEFRVGALVNAPNPCGVFPCQNGGQCNRITNSFECTCPAGFSGNKCQDRTTTTACSSSPCLNGGVCTASISGYACTCISGYTGPRCETAPPSNACSSAPCLNGGNCQTFNNGFFCACVNRFTGTRCQIPPPSNACSSAPCLNGGNCQTFNNGYFCACVNGFIGNRCQTTPPSNACSSAPCLNGGNCQTFNNGYFCACVNGFTGTRCQTPPTPNACLSSPCLNGGQCAINGNGFRCTCLGGFSGTRCEIPEPSDPCSSSPCMNGAQCITFGGTNNNDNYFCICSGGFTGINCETSDEPSDPCSSSPCMNGAQCITYGGTNNNDNYFCICSGGFTGINCETSTTNACASSPCLNGGQCAISGTGFRCTCASGFTGTRCEFAEPSDPCSSSPCMNDARCITYGVNNENYFCICVGDFTGINCETSTTSPCSPNPCSNGGTCNSVGNSFSCSCRQGFTGNTCQTQIGDVIPPTVTNCPQNIERTTSSSTATTADVIFVVPTVTDNSGEAFVAYSIGQGTSLSVRPANPDQQGRERLQATFSIGQTIVTVVATDISGNSNNQCQFTVTVNQPSTACSPNPCSNGGTCNSVGNSFTCSCPDGFTGNRCQTSTANPCASNPCPPQLQCFYTTSPSQYICSGNTGRKRRDVDGVSSNGPCQNGGLVEEGEHGSRCTCRPGFTGILCEVQIELEDINRTMVPTNHDLQPPIPRGHFLTNATVMVAMAVLMIVIVVLALVVCRLRPRNRNSILLGKSQRADEVAIVQ
ncbi:uncharacterized protein [Amphiura filiformis]|uniref:uncharacterized protein isoform X6 n=1 Tax=Amphiura filiformis TaxID=82378 RepID=UPI003B21959F